MEEKIHVIHTGPRPTCEVVEPSDEISVVIRYAGNHKEKLTLPRSVVPALAEVLAGIVKPASSKAKSATASAGPQLVNRRSCGAPQRRGRAAEDAIS